MNLNDSESFCTVNFELEYSGKLKFCINCPNGSVKYLLIVGCGVHLFISCKIGLHEGMLCAPTLQSLENRLERALLSSFN